MNDKKALLNEIRAIDFAIHETGLFLNAYDCNEAIGYLNAANEKRRKLVAEYEANYGPLRKESGVDHGNWAWAKGPWPWESEAN